VLKKKTVFSGLFQYLAEVGTRNFLFDSALQSQFRNLKEALLQLFIETLLCNRNSAIPQLLKKRCSATATLQFRNHSFFWCLSLTLSPQLESFISAIFGIFLAMESGRFMKKKLEKTSCATVPLRQVFGFERNRQF
jgi:hypothetical protein